MRLTLSLPGRVDEAHHVLLKHDKLGASYPDAGIAIFHDGVDGERRGKGRGVDTAEYTSLDSEETVVCTDPDATGVVLHEGSHKLITEAVGSDVDAITPLIHVDQPAALGAQPEASVASFEDAEDAVVAKRHVRVAGKEMKVRAIEASKASGCGNP